MRLSVWILTLIASMTLIISASQAGEPVAPASTGHESRALVFAADVWCPVNCADNSSRNGLAVDILRKIYEPLGYHVDYVVMPWSRAVSLVQKGDVTAVIGSMKSEQPDLVYPKEHLIQVHDAFFALASKRPAYSGLESLKGLRIGVISGYGYSEQVMNLLTENAHIPGGVQAASGNNAVEQNIRKLLAGRVAVVCETPQVMGYYLKEMNLQDKIISVGSVPSDEAYIGFSPALPQSKVLVEQYDQGIARLRASGELLHLYQSYGAQP